MLQKLSIELQGDINWALVSGTGNFEFTTSKVYQTIFNDDKFHDDRTIFLIGFALLDHHFDFTEIENHRCSLFSGPEECSISISDIHKPPYRKTLTQQPFS